LIVLSIWRNLTTSFDEKLPRRTAVLIKENKETTAYFYPLDFGKIGYNLDMRTASTYEEQPDFSFYFDEFGTGDLGNKPNPTRLPFYFKSMENAPNYNRRQIAFANFGLDMQEEMGSACDTGVTWQFTFRQRTLHRQMNRRFYLVFTCDAGLTVSRSDLQPSVFALENKAGKQLWLVGDVVMDCGTYDSLEAYREAIFSGNLNGMLGAGRYFVLALIVEFPRAKYSSEQQQTTRMLGISTLSAEFALANLIPNLADQIEMTWNSWLERIPAPDFPNSQVARSYYKCWAVIRQNYFQHPTWGHILLEALPVYKGLWTWGTSALPYNSLLDPDHPGVFLRNALNLFCDSIREDGFISHAIYIDEQKPGERWARGKGVIQTPHFPWVALAYYRDTGDKESIRRWYEPLRHYYRFICDTRDAKLENLHLWAALTSFDTGLDVAPAFTDITYYDAPYVYPAIFAAERCRYEQSMGEIAQILGLEEAAEDWFGEAKLTLSAANKVLWDKDKCWYGVKHADGTLETAVSLDGLFFLAYNLVSQEQADLMKSNVAKLIGQYGVFTAAPDEPKYEADYYWRGPAWPKSCATAAHAVVNYYADLRAPILSAITNWALAWPSIWECLNGETGQVACADVGVLATPFVSTNVGAGELIGAFWDMLAGERR
jgi:hypothetical protein